MIDAYNTMLRAECIVANTPVRLMMNWLRLIRDALIASSLLSIVGQSLSAVLRYSFTVLLVAVAVSREKHNDTRVHNNALLSNVIIQQSCTPQKLVLPL
jgi:hypothetical protein